MSDLYENLLRATDNTNNITNEKYGVITKIDNSLCSIKEEEADIEHTNVPILNGEYLEVGDNVVIGFVDNSIYNPIVLGKVSKDMKAKAEFPCSFQVLDEDLVFDFCDESGSGGTVDDNKSSTKIIESMALDNIGTLGGANQQEINLAINQKIGSGGTGVNVDLDMELMDNGYLKISVDLIGE